MNAEGAPAHTFVFADLAGFTALTEAHGDERAADLAETFSGRVREWMGDHDLADAKGIGDAMMLRLDSAAEAVRLALRIVDEISRLPGFPVVRAGLNTGPAVMRGGDWFGSTVNVAARVSAAAGGGEVLLTEATRLAAVELSGVVIEKIGPRELRNVAEPVVLYHARADSASADELLVDPVCRMAVDPERAAGTLRFAGREYVFCSLECARRFTARPERYA